MLQLIVTSKDLQGVVDIILNSSTKDVQWFMENETDLYKGLCCMTKYGSHEAENVWLLILAIGQLVGNETPKDTAEKAIPIVDDVKDNGDSWSKEEHIRLYGILRESGLLEPNQIN